jgi:hypothetical protein
MICYPIFHKKDNDYQSYLSVALTDTCCHCCACGSCRGCCTASPKYATKKRTLVTCTSVFLGLMLVTFCISLLCYPGDSMVELESGEMRTLFDVNIGDKVKTLKHVNGEWKVIYSPIYFFAHRNYRDGNYLHIHYHEIFNNTLNHHNITGSGSGLFRISEEHVLFLADCLNMKSVPRPITASELQVGQCLWKISTHTLDENSNSTTTILNPVKVDRIENKTLNSQFAPFTLEGTLIVDGIYTSSFANYHYIGHALFAPLRIIYSTNENWLDTQYIRYAYNAYFRGLYVIMKVGGFIAADIIEKVLYYIDCLQFNGQMNLTNLLFSSIK